MTPAEDYSTYKLLKSRFVLKVKTGGISEFSHAFHVTIINHSSFSASNLTDNSQLLVVQNKSLNALGPKVDQWRGFYSPYLAHSVYPKNSVIAPL